jgi:hypothetical protein
VFSENAYLYKLKSKNQHDSDQESAQLRPIENTLKYFNLNLWKNLQAHSEA